MLVQYLFQDHLNYLNVVFYTVVIFHAIWPIGHDNEMNHLEQVNESSATDFLFVCLFVGFLFVCFVFLFLFFVCFFSFPLRFVQRLVRGKELRIGLRKKQTNKQTIIIV